jgi:hypothetical protein
MNKDQRIKLENLVSKLQDIQEEVTNIKDEEQEKYDNLPEGLQASEKGEALESAIGNLEEAEANIDEVINGLESAME